MPDSMETRLESVDKSSDWTTKVSLGLYAYLSESEYFDENTLVFDCNPEGSNYNRAYLEVSFANTQIIENVRDFIAYHLSNNTTIKRSLDVPVEDGHFVLSVAGSSERNESDNFDEITIRANNSRIEFGGPAAMTPYIYTYELAKEGEPQDDNNSTQILNFLEEVIGNDKASSGTVELNDNELISRCLPKYKRGEYSDAARLAGQILEERVKTVAPESVADLTGAKLMKQAFNPDEGPIQMADEAGEQEGIMFLYAGTYQAIRNPLSHRTPNPEKERYLDNLDQVQTRNILHLVDFLLMSLDQY